MAFFPDLFIQASDIATHGYIKGPSSNRHLSPNPIWNLPIRLSCSMIAWGVTLL
jgi:hypothetical protein